MESDLCSGVHKWDETGAFEHLNYFASGGSHRDDRLPQAPLTKAGNYMDSSPGTLDVSLSVQ